MLLAKARPEIALLVLTRQVVACRVRRGKPMVGTVRSVVIQEFVGDRDVALTQALAQLQELMSQQLTEVQAGRGGRVWVALSDAWVSALTLPWRGARQLHAPHERWSAEGHALESDAVVVTADGAYRQPTVSISYPATLLNALKRFSEHCQGDLASVRVLSDLVWVKARKVGFKPQAVAILERGVTTLAMGARSIQDIIVRVSGAGGSDSLDRAELVSRLWGREVLREPTRGELDRLYLFTVDEVRLTDWVPADEQAAWADRSNALMVGAQSCSMVLPALHLLIEGTRWARTELDAVQQSRAASIGTWAVAAVLVVSSLLVTYLGYQARHAAEVSEQISSEVLNQPAPAPRELSEGERKRLGVVNDVIQALNLPVDTILDALEPPKDIQVGIVNLELKVTDGPSGLVLVTAETDTPADMVRYVEFLASRSIYESVQLKTHERLPELSRIRYRFALEIKWRH